MKFRALRNSLKVSSLSWLLILELVLL